MLELLRALTWPEWRHHPLRQATAVLAIALGVALAYAVHLINASALAEFSAAVRSVNGQPDLELRAQGDGFDETLYARVAAHRWVAAASPVVEVSTYGVVDAGTGRSTGADSADATRDGATQAAGPGAATPGDADAPRTHDGSADERLPLRVLGLDAFATGALAPALVPRPDRSAPREAVFDPQAVFLNPTARARLGQAATLRLQAGSRWVAFTVSGQVGAEGPPLAVVDIAGVQEAFGWLGRLSRIELRLVPGADRERLLAELGLPPGVQASTPDDAALRISNLSRAYRVNLTVLALVALFTGGFLVFSVLALSVAQRQPQLALLGVLGLDAAARRRLVLVESLVLGALGSVAGLLLGLALAAAALRWLAGDLGGGYFPGVAPSLHVGAGGLALHAALGLATALAGAWLPARMAEGLAPAQALKGLGTRGAAADDAGAVVRWFGPALLAAGGLLALAPPLFGIPLAAYLSVAALLFGGIACVPAGIAALLRVLPPPRGPLALLAVERARDQRHHATVAVAGVVASLALAVALTVMVASFRHSVTQWLDNVLPADLYLRTSRSTAAADTAFLAPDFVASLAALPGVAAVAPLRVVSVQLRPDRPAVALIARALADDPARALPLVGALAPPVAGRPDAYVSEAMRDLYGVKPGDALELPLPDGRPLRLQVRGIWRDYARQHGAVAVSLADYRAASGDTRVNDVALTLAPGTDPAAVQARILERAPQPGLLEFASASEIRRASLAIFDRSFAVTYWLQAVAIGIGLFGIAASFSAQVLARRRELGLLAHLGLTRRQILGVVAGEGAAWTAAGALLGIGLGLAVSLVLVHVVNPQSFHWTMDLWVPWDRLAALFAAVLAAGSLTAWIAARRAAGRDLVLAVKEDW